VINGRRSRVLKIKCSRTFPHVCDILSPLRGWIALASFPTAYAVGCILAPLRGYRHAFNLIGIGIATTN